MQHKTPYNDNLQSHGHWEYYYDNNQLHYKGNYINGKRNGYWEVYHYNGELFYIGNFINDIKKGYWIFYKENGEQDEKDYHAR